MTTCPNLPQNQASLWWAVPLFSFYLHVFAEVKHNIKSVKWIWQFKIECILSQVWQTAIHKHSYTPVVIKHIYWWPSLNTPVQFHTLQITSHPKSLSPSLSPSVAAFSLMYLKSISSLSASPRPVKPLHPKGTALNGRGGWKWALNGSTAGSQWLSCYLNR